MCWGAGGGQGGQSAEMEHTKNSTYDIRQLPPPDREHIENILKTYKELTENIQRTHREHTYKQNIQRTFEHARDESMRTLSIAHMTHDSCCPQQMQCQNTECIRILEVCETYFYFVFMTRGSCCPQ